MRIARPTALFIVVPMLLQSGHVGLADQPVSDSSPTSPTAKPHLKRAVEVIRRQIGWFGATPSQYSREFLAAVATMNYVQSRVSPLNYSLLIQNRDKLPSEPEAYLKSGAGICGGQVMTARAILNQLGIRNRPVEFYLHGKSPSGNQSHIGIEVFYEGQWHFFDITWGTFFRHQEVESDKVLPIGEVLMAENAAALAVTNTSDLWYQQWTTAGLDPFAYIKTTEKDVVVGGNGTIHLQPVADPDKGLVYTPTHQPNYVGRNSRTADSGSVSFRLNRVGKQLVKCTITISGVAGAGQLVVRAKSGTAEVPLSELKPGDQEVDLSNLSVDDELLITVNPEKLQEIGYVVFTQISVQTH